MGAVVAGTAGVHVQVVVRVVKGKGDLCSAVNLAGSDAGLFLLGLQAFGCQDVFNVRLR